MDIGKWEQAKRWLTRPKGINEKALDDYHDDSSVDRGYGVGYRPRSIPDNFVPVMPQAPGLQDPATSIKELATGGRVSLGKGGEVKNIIAADLGLEGVLQIYNLLGIPLMQDGGTVSLTKTTPPEKGPQYRGLDYLKKHGRGYQEK